MKTNKLHLFALLLVGVALYSCAKEEKLQETFQEKGEAKTIVAESTSGSDITDHGEDGDHDEKGTEGTEVGSSTTDKSTESRDFDQVLD